MSNESHRDFSVELRHWVTPPPCKHGNAGACGHCMAEAAPKCRHGNVSYCGFCLAETGGGRVSDRGNQEGAPCPSIEP